MHASDAGSPEFNPLQNRCNLSSFLFSSFVVVTDAAVGKGISFSLLALAVLGLA